MSHYTPHDTALKQASNQSHPTSKHQLEPTAEHSPQTTPIPDKQQVPEPHVPAQPATTAATTPPAIEAAQFRSWLRSNRMGFLAAGFAIAAWAPIIPFVKERFLLDEHGLGLLLLCVGTGSLFSSPLSGFLTSRFGCKIPIFGAAIVWALCIALISVVTNLHLMALILFVFGMAAVILEVVSNINGARIEQVSGKTVMSGLHALYSLGGLLGSFGVTFILGAGAGVVLSASMAALFMLIAVLVGGKHLFNRAQLEEPEQIAPTYTQATKSASAPAPAPSGRILQKRYVLHPTVLLVSFMLFVLYLTEGAMLDWSGVFLFEVRHVDLEMAGYGYAAFAIMMTTFRFLGDHIVLRMGRRRVIVLGTILICAGFCISAFVDHVYSNLLCFALIGIGSSNVIPQLVSYVAKCQDVPMHIAVTLVNSFGFTGVLIGPALIGFVAHLIGLQNTFVVLGVFVLTVTFLSYRYISSSLTAGHS